MKRELAILVGLVLLPLVPAHAAGTVLNVTCLTKDLPAGAVVWMQVEPEHYQSPAPSPTSLGEASGATETATGASVWRFEVPTGGAAPASTHRFTFPSELQAMSREKISAIRLKVSYRVDAPGQQGPYGQIIEGTLGMPVREGPGSLMRCLRLRDDKQKLILESAPDCSDSAFANMGHNGRVVLRPSGQ